MSNFFNVMNRNIAKWLRPFLFLFAALWLQVLRFNDLQLCQKVADFKLSFVASLPCNRCQVSAGNQFICILATLTSKHP